MTGKPAEKVAQWIAALAADDIDTVADLRFLTQNDFDAVSQPFSKLLRSALTKLRNAK